MTSKHKSSSLGRSYEIFRSLFFHLRKKLFPKMLIYNRFVELMPRIPTQLNLLLFAHKGKVTGISSLDRTVIKVCNIKRTKKNKVFKNVAALGKALWVGFLDSNFTLSLTKLVNFLHSRLREEILTTEPT